MSEFAVLYHFKLNIFCVFGLLVGHNKTFEDVNFQTQLICVQQKAKILIQGLV